MRITGELVTLSELHIGSGTEEEIPPPGGQVKEQEPRRYASICLDVHGAPYIPGASLRGYLAQALAVGGVDPRRHARLFGIARRRHEESLGAEQDYGNAGALRVYDALWQGSAGATGALRSRVGIDAITGTAEAHKLFTHAVVLPGGIFRVHLELVRIGEYSISQRDITAVLGGLAGLNYCGWAALGQGKGHGRGKLRWRADSVRVTVLTREALRDWLLDDGALDTRFETLETVEPDRLSVEPPLRFGLRLVPLAPLLVKDPEVVKNKEADPQAPDLNFFRVNDRVVVPGSSLRGLVRARCRRILLTMLEAASAASRSDDDPDGQANQLIGELFGSDEAAGWIRFGDATARFRQGDRHRQFFNAVDRFTGGVRQGALYHVEAIWPDVLRARIELRPEVLQKDRRWMLGLLALVLRDAMEEDLAVGWGRGRGFGAFRAEVRLPARFAHFADWQSFCQTEVDGRDIGDALAITARRRPRGVARRTTVALLRRPSRRGSRGGGLVGALRSGGGVGRCPHLRLGAVLRAVWRCAQAAGKRLLYPFRPRHSLQGSWP